MFKFISLDFEFIKIDDLFEFLNIRIYFEEEELQSILDKIISNLKNKNYHKIKLQVFIYALFQENLRNIPKFLIDFFIRYENNLNNYIEIFSKDLKNSLKKITEINSKAVIHNKNHKNESDSNKIKNNFIDKKEWFLEFKKFFDLSFKKSVFTVDEKNLLFKAMVFTKILKNIIKSKGLTVTSTFFNMNKHNNFIDGKNLDNFNNNSIEPSK